MSMTGPTFIALQVRDVQRSATFYEERLGMRRAPAGPPGAVVFDTAPAAFAVREPLPGVDLDAASPHPGIGVALWRHADDAQALHDSLAEAGVQIAAAPSEGPFGRQFAPAALPARDGDDGALRTVFRVEADWSAAAQAARFLGLDVDARTWPDVGERDPVIACAQETLSSSRPCGFHSSYEAAA